MKWIIVITVLIISIAFFSCTPTKKVDKKDSIAEQPEESVAVQESEEIATTEKPKESPIFQKLKGDWTLYKEICCGRRSIEKTGQQLETQTLLIFESKNQVTITNLKARQSRTVPYKIELPKKGSQTEVIYINWEGKKGILRFENNDLIIDYGYMDLQKEFYKKN